MRNQENWLTQGLISLYKIDWPAPPGWRDYRTPLSMNKMLQANKESEFFKIWLKDFWVNRVTNLAILWSKQKWVILKHFFHRSKNSNCCRAQKPHKVPDWVQECSNFVCCPVLESCCSQFQIVQVQNTKLELWCLQMVYGQVL